MSHVSRAPQLEAYDYEAMENSTTIMLTDTITATSPGGQLWMAFIFYTATKYIHYIYSPAVLLLGNFGNLMTIIIMQRMASEGSTINIYLVALAVVDAIKLTLMTLPLWLSHLLGYDVMATHDVLCRTNTLVYVAAGCTSCWCLVCMTVQRAFSVVWPHRVNLLCTRRTVLLLIAAITLFFVLFYSHLVVFRERSVKDSNGSTTYHCASISEDYTTFFQNIFVYLDVAFYCFLPFIFIVVSNSILVWKLTLSVKETGRRLTAQGDWELVQAREKAANSVTLTVVVLSMAFLTLTLPNSIFFMLHHSAIFYVFEDKQPGYDKARMMFIHDVCFFFSVTNNAVNFYLYCLTGKKFREEFIKIMSCWRSRGQSGASSGIRNAAELSTHRTQLAASSVKTAALAKCRKP